MRSVLERRAKRVFGEIVRRSLLVVLLAGMAAVFFGDGAMAHPHVFIKHSMTLIFGADDIVGVRMRWTFDEMYSSMIKSDYTKSKDGRLTPEDVRAIEKENFANLANFGFFVDVRINDKPIRVTSVKDFDAQYKANRIIFEFTVPLATAAPEKPNVIELDAFDPEYYVEFTIADQDAEAVSIEHGERFATGCTVKRDIRRNSELGPVNTDVVECTYEPKS
jgi:ABC-type uncharacterized transport system substrate-binding protein